MVTVGDKIIVVFGREQVCNRVIHKFCYDVELTFCSFLSKFTYSKNLKTGTIHLKNRKYTAKVGQDNVNIGVVTISYA